MLQSEARVRGAECGKIRVAGASPAVEHRDRRLIWEVSDASFPYRTHMSRSRAPNATPPPSPINERVLLVSIAHLLKLASEYLVVDGAREVPEATRTPEQTAAMGKYKTSDDHRALRLAVEILRKDYDLQKEQRRVARAFDIGDKATTILTDLRPRLLDRATKAEARLDARSQLGELFEFWEWDVGAGDDGIISELIGAVRARQDIGAASGYLRQRIFAILAKAVGKSADVLMNVQSQFKGTERKLAVGLRGRDSVVAHATGDATQVNDMLRLAVCAVATEVVGESESKDFERYTLDRLKRG